jgi:hypothetical protein
MPVRRARRGEPGGADLDDVRLPGRALQRVPGRPGPALDVHEARRAHDLAGGGVDRDEGDRLAGRALAQREVDVRAHRRLVGRHERERERRAPAPHHLEQRGHVRRRERLEPDMAAVESELLVHGPT